MKAKHTKRHDIIKEARMRFASGDYGTIQKLHSIKCSDKVVCIAHKILKPEDIFKFYDYVVKVQESGEIVTDAIGNLIDEKIYTALDEENRERYVLEVSSLYNFLLNVYKTKQTKAI